jgi:hypothetical protein
MTYDFYALLVGQSSYRLTLNPKTQVTEGDGPMMETTKTLLDTSLHILCVYLYYYFSLKSCAMSQT